MKILFIGKIKGNSRLTYQTIKEIYKETEFIDINKIFKYKIFYIIFYHLSPEFFNLYIFYFFKKKIKKKYDLIYINNCEFINRSSIRLMKKKSDKIYFYCEDNPFVSRDKKRWKLTTKCFDLFDLVIFHQRNRLKYIKEYNIKKYIVIIPPYFNKLVNNIKKKKNQDIVFIGTWFPERGKFFYELKKMGLKFKIYGLRWDQDRRYFNILKKNIILKGINLKNVMKIYKNSKISIGLLSKGNDDDITRRCIEIPISKSLLCSEETETLKDLFIENKEAVYFRNSKECYEKCNLLLKNSKLLNRISINGFKKVKTTLKLDANKIFKKILNPKFINELKKPLIKKF